MNSFLNSFKKYDIQSYRYIFRYLSRYKKPILRKKILDIEDLSKTTNRDLYLCIEQGIKNNFYLSPNISHQISSKLQYYSYKNDIRSIKYLLLQRDCYDQYIIDGIVYNRNYPLIKWVIRYIRRSDITFSAFNNNELPLLKNHINDIYFSSNTTNYSLVKSCTIINTFQYNNNPILRKHFFNH